jgi:hypothetical protein
VSSEGQTRALAVRSLGSMLVRIPWTLECRISLVKFLGVPGVFDYAGLNRSSRYRACSCCLPRISRTSASGLHLFGAEYPPRLSSVYASLSTSRYPVQDSRPSGSLLLSRKALSSLVGPRSTRESKTVGVSFSCDSAPSLCSSLNRSPRNHSGTRFENRLRLLLHNIANRRNRCTLIVVFRNQKRDSGYKCTE